MAPAVGGALTARRFPWRRLEEPAAIALAGALLAAVSLLPLLWPVLALLGTGIDLPARGVAALGAARIVSLLLVSLGIASAVTLLSLLLGVPLGLFLGRFDVPGRRAALLLQAFPMFLPPFLPALGWFHLFGRQGFLGSDWSGRLLFSGIGLVAVLSLTFAPVAATLVALGLRGIDPSLDEAARAVASPLRVAVRILLPAVRPSLGLAAIVVFALAFAELGVPAFLRVTVYPEAVFARLGAIDPRPEEAWVLALPQLAVALALLWIERRLFAGRPFAVAGLRGREVRSLPLGRLRPAAGILVWALTLALLAPVLALVLRAARGGGFAGLGDWIGASVWNSLIAGAVAASAITLLALILGPAIARSRPGSRTLDALAVLAFFTPSAVVATSLIALWNRPSTQAVYGSLAILVLGSLARYPAIGIRAFACSVMQSHPNLEEAAAASGAGPLRRLGRIVIPLHARGAAAAWLLSFVFCLRDLETAVAFRPPGLEPLTVRIFTLEANGPEPVVAALAVVQVALTAALCLLGAAAIPRGARA